MSKRKLMLIIAAFAVVGCLVGVFSMRQAAQDRSASPKDDATSIQEGIMTDSQREHSKLYKNFGNRKIIDLLKKTDGVVVERDAPNQNPFLTEDTEDPLTASARRAVCGSDVVLVGLVLKKESQLTEDGFFIFTDYTISPLTTIKIDVLKIAKVPESLILSQPGGKIKINGRTAYAEDKMNPNLIVGQKYLFPLRLIPNTQDFVAGVNSTFLPYTADDPRDDVENSSSPKSVASAQASISKKLAGEPCSNVEGGVKQ